MRPFLLVIMTFLFIGNLFAQNNGRLTGVIQDTENNPITQATVSIINVQDSSVISYTISDDKGKFQFARIPQQRKLVLFVSHISADVYQKDFEIGESGSIDFGIIEMTTGITMDEITVTAMPPVRMNKDTLEYNADYFKTRPNANVEELLRELPGLQVNMDGTIYYEGKEVSEVRVDGKEFFASDVRIATRNLDASLIKTVQVFRDRGESKRNVDDEENLPITINLKFKQEFLSTQFGKVYGSGGSQERYEAGALFNTFRDTMQVSFIAYGNNINRESFDYNELNQHAGLGRAENYGFNDFGGRNYWGIGNDIAGGVNLNNNWGRNPRARNTKLNVMYMYRYKNRESGNDGNSIFRLDDREQYSDYMHSSRDKSHQHNINSLLRHRFDSTAYLEFRPQIGFNSGNARSETNSDTRTDTGPLTENTNENTNKSTQVNYSHSFRIEKELHKEHVLSFSNNLHLNNSESNRIAESNVLMFQTADPDTYIWDNRIQHRRTNSTHFSTAYYNKMIEKLPIDLYFTVNTGTESPVDSFYYNRNDSGIILGDRFHNNYRFTYQDYISGIKFSWKPVKDWIVNFGTAYHVKRTDFDLMSAGQERKNTVHYWLPNINARYKQFTIGWSRDVRNPETHAIQSQVNDLTPTYTQLPSLDFDNMLTDQAFIRYNKNTPKYQAGGSLSMYRYGNSIASRTWQDMDIGHTTIQMYQAGERHQYSGHAYFRYNFKTGDDWQYYTSTTPNLFIHQNYQTINGIENTATNTGWNISQEFNIRWKNLVGISPKYSLQINSNNNSVKDNPDFRKTSYVVHDYGLGLNINPIKGFSLEATYSLQNRASGMDTRANYNIINSSLYYTMRDNSQLKLSVFDLLNQNVQNHWGMSANATYYSNSLTLRQYFLLGYIYKFNATKTKD